MTSWLSDFTINSVSVVDEIYTITGNIDILKDDKVVLSENVSIQGDLHSDSPIQKRIKTEVQSKIKRLKTNAKATEELKEQLSSLITELKNDK
jgi:hypothetical protein